MTPSPSFTAVIAAAGLSSRMGAFKPVLPLGGESISRRLIDAFMKASSLPAVVVTGFQSELLSDHLKGLPVRLVHNEAYEASEMFDSLRLGLSFLQKQAEPLPDKLFLCPADLPLITPQTILLMAGQDAAVVIPTCGGRRGHPVCIASSLFPRILAHDGRDGLRGALRGLEIPPLLLPVSDPGILMDADTREDYQRLMDVCREAAP